MDGWMRGVEEKRWMDERSGGERVDEYGWMDG